MNYKEFADLLMLFYNAGIIALAIVMLAIAIIIFPTIWKRSHRSSGKSIAHRIRK